MIYSEILILRWISGCLAAGGARNSGAPKTPRGAHCQRVKGKISCLFSAETCVKQTSF